MAASDPFVWRMLGAWQGGTVNTVALSPQFEIDQLALAATAAGVFRSTDGGETWQWSSVGLADPYVLAVAFAPQNGSEDTHCFATTNQGRLYTSGDGGQTWAEVTAWAGLGRVTALAVSPGFSADHTFFAGTTEGVFRTQDSGKSWESSTFGLHDLDVLCLACAPDFATSEVLWAGTAEGGFYRSRNGGRSWRDSGEGLPDDAITCLLVSPRFDEDQTLFVGTEHTGLFRSSDGGWTWTAVSLGLTPVSILCLSASADGQRLLLGTDQGMMVSPDGGQTWTPAQQGAFAALSLAYTAGDVVIAGAIGEGVHRSLDGGQRWRAAMTGLIAHAPPVVAYAGRGVLFAHDHTGMLAYSPDSGAHWHTLDNLPDEAGITAIAAVGSAASTQLWLATADGACHRATYREDDFSPWVCCVTPEEDGPVFYLIALVADDRSAVVFLGGDDGRIYRWTEAEGVQVTSYEPPWSGATLLQLAVSPTVTASPQLIAITVQPASTGHYQIQLWDSQDGGAHWAHLAGLESEVPAVALAWPVDPVEQAIFLATRNRVVKIYQANQQLTVSQAFLDEAIGVTAVVASPDFANDRTLYAATNRGVYRSLDAGATWQVYGHGLAERTIVGLLPVADNGGLMAVELGGAIWAPGE